LFGETGSTITTRHRQTKNYMTIETTGGADIHVTCNISTRRMMRGFMWRQRARVRVEEESVRVHCIKPKM